MSLTPSNFPNTSAFFANDLLKPNENKTVRIAVLSSYPPRECGIATYTQDLIQALQNKHQKEVEYHIIAIDKDLGRYCDDDQVKMVLDPGLEDSYQQCSSYINTHNIDLLLIQHEFGLFHENENGFFNLLKSFQVPIFTVFHTVLPHPNSDFLDKVQLISSYMDQIIVMTEKSKEILLQHYSLEDNLITVIPHGTHKVTPKNTETLKKKYDVEGLKVVATFGLLGPGKSIETTLKALPTIIEKHPDLIFLILGKTHPSLVAENGEIYRDYLEGLVLEFGIERHVRFINKFLETQELLEYLQLTDIYLFTSKDPNQAVSGTFSYAVSCGCPIISTPIPHAIEVLNDDVGSLFNFGDSNALALHVLAYFEDEEKLHTRSLNALHISSFNTWENSAIRHIVLFNQYLKSKELYFKVPEVKLRHIFKLTTNFGMLQFSKFSSPDIDSGYTLDDNARALIFALEYYSETRDLQILNALKLYLEFIIFCYQPETKTFLNYVDYTNHFTEQNDIGNLEDSNGRAIWALGTFLKFKNELPNVFLDYVPKVEQIIESFLLKSIAVSPRSISFIAKGILNSLPAVEPKLRDIISQKLTKYGDILIGQYRANREDQWDWFEPYITYGNAIISEALVTIGDYLKHPEMVKVAEKTMQFLINHTFKNNYMELISNKTWFDKGNIEYREQGGEQPIDAAYTTIALAKFDEICPDRGYDKCCEKSFDWFLGRNRLQQSMYDKKTGGCYDGLETKYVNLNQGAESTVCYHLANNAVRGLWVKKRLTSKKLKKNRLNGAII